MTEKPASEDPKIIMSQIKDHLKEEGFMQKQDLDGLLKSVGELKVQQVIDHKCEEEGCAVCSMKSNLDGSGYERGLIDGVQVGQKYEVKKS